MKPYGRELYLQVRQVRVDCAILMNMRCGAASACQRLGLIAKKSNGSITLGTAGERYEFIDAGRASQASGRADRLRELCEAIVTPWPSLKRGGRPLSQDTISRIIDDLDLALKGLGSWAMMGSDYLRPHVTRKMMLWLWKNYEGKSVSLDRAAWLRLCPDVNGYLQGIPANWDMERIAKIAAGIDPIFYSMWCCLLGAALRQPGAQEFWRDDPKAAVEKCRRALDAMLSEGLRPSPVQLFKEAMLLH